MTKKPETTKPEEQVEPEKPEAEHKPETTAAEVQAEADKATTVLYEEAAVTEDPKATEGNRFKAVHYEHVGYGPTKEDALKALAKQQAT